MTLLKYTFLRGLMYRLIIRVFYYLFILNDKLSSWNLQHSTLGNEMLGAVFSSRAARVNLLVK